jgi:hypothetical protein
MTQAQPADRAQRRTSIRDGMRRFFAYDRRALLIPLALLLMRLLDYGIRGSLVDTHYFRTRPKHLTSPA